MNVTLKNLLAQVTKLQQKIEGHKPFDESLNKAIQERLRIEWTYNSNAIEGNTLTLGETAFFLQEGLTSGGKPLKDFLEVKNHAEAISVLDEVMQDKQKITEHFIRSLHQLLLKDIEYTHAKGQDGKLIKKPLNLGAYKTRPNHVLTVSGKIHHYPLPEQVPVEMENLLKWYYSEAGQVLSVIERATIFHYRFVSIHPFDDGNGRMARLLMNLILMQAGFPPCIVKNGNRRQYLSELEKIDKTNQFESFTLFIAQELLETMTLIVSELLMSQVTSSEQSPAQKRQSLILYLLEDQELSVGQIGNVLRQIKRPTLKKDLQELVASGRIQKNGVGKGVVYSVKS